MRGQVLKRDDASGQGLILGDDGRRYTFSQAQVRGDTLLAEGAAVDFIDLGEEARDIYPIPVKAAVPVAAAAPPAIAPASTGREAVKADGLWTYFTRALSRNYFRFTGRARRSEYWGFTLFLFLALVVTLCIDLIVSLTFFGLDDVGDQIYLPILSALLYLYAIIPGIAITVRRLHDLDMTGWLYLITLIPYIGGLILFVFLVLDSKTAPNTHGASPKYPAVTQADTFA